MFGGVIHPMPPCHSVVRRTFAYDLICQRSCLGSSICSGQVWKFAGVSSAGG